MEIPAARAMCIDATVARARHPQTTTDWHRSGSRWQRRAPLAPHANAPPSRTGFLPASSPFLSSTAAVAAGVGLGSQGGRTSGCGGSKELQAGIKL